MDQKAAINNIKLGVYVNKVIIIYQKEIYKRWVHA